MTAAVVALVIVALMLAVAAGFGWGGLFVADRLHEDQRDIELRIRTLAQMEQVQAVGTWAAREIAKPTADAVQVSPVEAANPEADKPLLTYVDTPPTPRRKRFASQTERRA